MRTHSRSVQKHLPAIATALVVLWLVAVYLYSIGGSPASAGRVGPKHLVETALGGKAPRQPLEKRSRPVTVDVEAIATPPNAGSETEGSGAVNEPPEPPTKQERRSARSLGHALPVSPAYASGDELQEPHHDYPALDISLNTGTKIRAVTGGRIKATTRWGACGRGVILKGKDDFTYTYCHGSRLQVGRGRSVRAGHTIMRSGNTGDSTGPHLHLQIRGPDGKLVCPQDLLPAWEDGKKKSPWQAKRHGCYTGGHRHDHKKDKNGKRR